MSSLSSTIQLEKDNSVSIHHRNLWVLAVEMDEAYTGTSEG